ALGPLWGARARSVLVAALSDADDGVRMAAVTALRSVRAIDAEVVKAFDGLLGGDTVELGAIAVAALAEAQPDARSPAVALLGRVVRPRGSVVAMLTSSSGEHPPLVVEAAARALLAIGGEEGRKTVELRAIRSSGDLQRKLRALVQG